MKILSLVGCLGAAVLVGLGYIAENPERYDEFMNWVGDPFRFI